MEFTSMKLNLFLSSCLSMRVSIFTFFWFFFGSRIRHLLRDVQDIGNIGDIKFMVAESRCFYEIVLLKASTIDKTIDFKIP